MKKQTAVTKMKSNLDVKGSKVIALYMSIEYFERWLLASADGLREVTAKGWERCQRFVE